MHIPKWLIATAAVLFVVLIAAVAFFLGRESAPQPATPSAVAAPAPAESEPESKAPVAEAASATTPPVAEPASGAVAPAPIAAPSYTPLPSPSAPAAVDIAPPATDPARARVSAYFSAMQALQSGAPIGDPQALATTILHGAVSGDFSGVDDLVRVAGETERRALGIQPPSECAEYHRMAVTLLQESRTMVTSLRDGLKRNDTEALTSLSTSAQGLKSRAEALAAAEKSLRARFGL